MYHCGGIEHEGYVDHLSPFSCCYDGLEAYILFSGEVEILSASLRGRGCDQMKWMRIGLIHA